MRKKILAVATCAAMVGAMMAGCGSTDSSSSAASSAASSAEASASSAAEASSASAAEASSASSAAEESSASSEEASTPAASDEPIAIAVLGKSVATDTWQQFYAGAQAACDEVNTNGNITLYTDGASDSTQREEQLNLIENYISKGVDGLCFATDAEGATEIVDVAHDDGTKVVLVDTPIEGYDTYDAMVTYDNVTAGELAANALLEAMDNAGIDYSGENARVVVQDPVSGVSTLDSRCEGINNVFAEKAPNVTVDIMYCQGDNAQALSNAQDAWQKYGNEIVGMIGLDEGVTDAISRCMDENGLYDQFCITGIDSTTLSVSDVTSGNVYAVVGMSMYALGYEGFMDTYKLCIGEEVEKETEMDPILVDANNYMDDDIRTAWDTDLVLGKTSE